MKSKEIKIKITYTDGYSQRFTKACVEVARKREKDETKN